jgi:hypothetical protein
MAESIAWRSMVGGSKPSASAMMATGASLVSSWSVPGLARCVGAEDVPQPPAQVAVKRHLRQSRTGSPRT